MEKMKISEALWRSGVIGVELKRDIEALEADAQRLNGVRMVVCESDKALRERMGEAMATVFETWGDTLTPETIVTVEAFNAMVDTALLAACEARK